MQPRGGGLLIGGDFSPKGSARPPPAFFSARPASEPRRWGYTTTEAGWATAGQAWPRPPAVRRGRRSTSSVDGGKLGTAMKEWARKRCTYMCVRFGSTCPAGAALRVALFEVGRQFRQRVNDLFLFLFCFLAWCVRLGGCALVIYSDMPRFQYFFLLFFLSVQSIPIFAQQFLHRWFQT